MDKIRGIVLIVLGVLALFHGWRIGPGHSAMLSYSLGALAIAIGVWRLMNRS